MAKPSIILTTQFTTPTAKSFTSYISYMTRKEALEKENELKDVEIDELNRINNAIKHIDMTFEDVQELNKDGSNAIEQEASTIIKSKDFFGEKEESFVKYIQYMSREQALIHKGELTTIEEKELSVCRKKIDELTEENLIDVQPDKPVMIKGAFSINKDYMTKKDLEQVMTIVDSAQKNGSIFYQDVISFDNEFLIKEKLLNPETNQLNEKRIKSASSKMMDQMFKDEKLDQGYWFASIHRNTENIHIHFGTVENKNTRKLITTEENGMELVAPKGKRRLDTLYNMKSTFANELVDHNQELARISFLRNDLVNEIKGNYRNKKEKYQVQLVENIYQSLPSNKLHWQYGSKYLSEEARNKIDELTDSLISDNPKYKEYLDRTEEEGLYRKELYGDSKSEEKDYEKNKNDDLKKRLGNALLKELKRSHEKTHEVRSNFSKAKTPQTNKSMKKENDGSINNKVFPNRQNIYHLKKALFNDIDKYRAQKDYERLQEQIAYNQQNNSL